MKKAFTLIPLLALVSSAFGVDVFRGNPITTNTPAGMTNIVSGIADTNVFHSGSRLSGTTRIHNLPYGGGLPTGFLQKRADDTVQQSSDGATLTNLDITTSPTALTTVTQIVNSANIRVPFIWTVLNGTTTNYFGRTITPGTTTAGIQEALDSFSKGTEVGPTAATVALYFSPGYHYFTNTILYSNIFTTSILMEGMGSLVDTRLVYAGTAKGVDCIRFESGGTTRLHPTIRNLGFSALIDTTNVLLRLANNGASHVEHCNFTQWQMTTNQSWGSGLSTGGATPPEGLVGLVIGNSFDHNCVIKDCFFAGLAVGFDSFTDHLYAYNPKFAFCGVQTEDTGINQWPNTHRYSLGAACMVEQCIDAHFYGPHFWSSRGIAAFGGQNIAVEYPIFEGFWPFFAALDTNVCNFVTYGAIPDFDNELPSRADDAASITAQIRATPTYSYAHGPVRWRRTIVDNPAYVFGDTTLLDGKLNGSVMGASNYSSSIIASRTTGSENVIIPAPRTSAGTNSFFMVGSKNYGLDGIWFYSSTRHSYTNAAVPGTACFTDGFIMSFTNATHSDISLDFIISGVREGISNSFAHTWTDPDENPTRIRSWFCESTNSVAFSRGPLGMLQVFGVVRDPSTDYDSDDVTVHFVNSPNQTTTLPDARRYPGRIIFIKNFWHRDFPNTPVTNTTVATTGGQKINNASTFTIGAQWESATFYSFQDSWTTIAQGEKNIFPGGIFAGDAGGLTNWNPRLVTNANSTLTSALIKGDGGRGVVNAVAGTDYAPATSGSSILKGNGSGGTATAGWGDFNALSTLTTNNGTLSTAVLVGDGARGVANTAVGAQPINGNGTATTAAQVVGRFTGTPDGTKFLRDDGTLVTPSSGGPANALTNLDTRQVTLTNGLSVADASASSINSSNSLQVGPPSAPTFEVNKTANNALVWVHGSGLFTDTQIRAFDSSGSAGLKYKIVATNTTAAGQRVAFFEDPAGHRAGVDVGSAYDLHLLKNQTIAAQCTSVGWLFPLPVTNGDTVIFTNLAVATQPYFIWFPSPGYTLVTNPGAATSYTAVGPSGVTNSDSSANTVKIGGAGIVTSTGGGLSDGTRFVAQNGFRAASDQPIGWASGNVSLGSASLSTYLTRDSANVIQGSDDAASPVDFAFKGPDGSGTDKNGGAFTIEGGQSTGTGRGGAVIMRTSLAATSTGSTANSYTTRHYISAKRVNLTESSATLVFNVSLAAGKHCGLHVFATTHADDGTDFNATCDEFIASAVNKGGTVTTGTSTVGTQTTSTSSSGVSTLTTAWTAVANGNGIDIKCNATSTLVQTTLAVRWRVEIDTDDSALTVTPQ